MGVERVRRFAEALRDEGFTSLYESAVEVGNIIIDLLDIDDDDTQERREAEGGA